MTKDENRTTRIRELNDQLRETFSGGGVLLTAGINALDERLRAAVLAAVMEFDAFDDALDPHGEHDVVAVTVEGKAILAKVDYYDLQYRYHSPDAADPAKTSRVLTIMLASEY